MNPQDPLAALHPLRTPELIGWWPPAPGWWLLLALAILGMAALLYRVRARYRRKAYRREALRKLQDLETAFRAGCDPQEHLLQLNALLKSVALAAYPRREVAPSHGQAWCDFLNAALPGSEKFDPAFATDAYRAEPPDIDMAALHRAAQTWISTHRAPP